jgi:hypothetical protein
MATKDPAVRAGLLFVCKVWGNWMILGMMITAQQLLPDCGAEVPEFDAMKRQHVGNIGLLEWILTKK